MFRVRAIPPWPAGAAKPRGPATADASHPAFIDEPFADGEWQRGRGLRGQLHGEGGECGDRESDTSGERHGWRLRGDRVPDKVAVSGPKDRRVEYHTPRGESPCRVGRIPSPRPPACDDQSGASRVWAIVSESGVGRPAIPGATERGRETTRGITTDGSV